MQFDLPVDESSKFCAAATEPADFHRKTRLDVAVHDGWGARVGQPVVIW